MAANDDIKQWAQSAQSRGGASPQILLPASPGVQWVCDAATLVMDAVAVAGTLEDGTFAVYDGPTTAAPILLTGVYEIFTAGAATFVGATVSLSGPARGTVSTAMLIAVLIFNGTPGAQFANISAVGHIL